MLRAGIATVHQNINDGVVAALDVATNLTLDRLNRAGGLAVPFSTLAPRAAARPKAVAARMGLDIDIDSRPIGDLPLADRQMVAIARAIGA